MQAKLCYFNEHWNVYLYTTGGYTSWKQVSQQVIPHEEGEYRLRIYDCSEIPIHTFGNMYNEENKHSRPGHGGEWSSNSRHINRIFGTDLIEIAADQCSVAVPLKWLKELLGDRVIWEKHDIYGEWITNIKGHDNIHDKWVTLPTYSKQESI